MRFFILAIILSFCLKGFNQQFTTRSFGVNEGLPSSQVYDIIQDLDRNIWVSTDAGVSKYDGYKFTNFTQNDGLADNTIVKMFGGKDGSILLQGFSKNISFLKGDSIYPFSKNEELLGLLGTNNIASIYYKDLENFVIGLSVSCSDSPRFIRFENGSLTEEIRSEIGVYVLPEGCWSSSYCQNKSLNFYSNSKQYELSVGPPQSILISDSLCWVVTKNTCELPMVIGAPKKTFSYQFSRAALLDSRKNVWLGAFGKGALIFNHAQLENEPIQILNGENISTIYEDVDGGVWLGSMSKGIWHVRNPRLMSINSLEGKAITKLRSINNSLYVFGQNGKTSELDFQSWSEFSLKEIPLEAQITDVLTYKKSRVFLLENEFELANSKEAFPSNGITYCYGPTPNEIWIGKIYSFSKFTDGVETFNSSEIDFQERVNTLGFYQSKLYIGTLSGLYSFDGEKITAYPKTKNIRIEHISFMDDQIYFATRGKGIGILEGQEVKFITVKEGLSSDFCTKVVSDSLGRIWVSGKKGIDILDNDKWHKLNWEDGLSSVQITDFALFKDHLFIASNNGLSALNLEYFNQTAPSLSTSFYTVSGNQGELIYGTSLPYDNNQIKFEYGAKEFRSKEPIVYRYRLLPDKNWNQTTQTEVTYSALGAGDYTFQIEAQKITGDWSDERSQFSFSVNPPFYFEWWFIGLCLLAIAFVLIFTIRYRERQIRRKGAVENELNALKIKALTSQMNPHFIFNSLNSIQNFLIDSDLRKSNKYLTMFAKLMRLVLNNSNKTFVPMQEVLNSLELYMELERLRFNEKFSYSIKVSPEISVEQTEIPAMLMQPFVENSILHGILPKKGNGKITLEIEKIGPSSLKCTITDDGVGRDFYKDRKSTTHKSQGLKITEERLEVFQSYFKNDFRFTFHDLKTEEGESKGTQVELILPFH